MRKVDIFNHVWPKAFHRKLEQVCRIVDITKRSNDVPMMVDLDERFRVMDLFDDYCQVLSLASPPLEVMAPPAIGTLFIFHQAHLVAIKGWDLMTFTAFFPVLSATVVISALVAGVLVDRFGAWRLMRLILLPRSGPGCTGCCTTSRPPPPVWPRQFSPQSCRPEPERDSTTGSARATAGLVRR